MIERLPPLEPLTVDASVHLAEWIHRGYLVGNGRRELDALVLRLPQEELLQRGLIRKPKRKLLGASSYKQESSGYGVDLIPNADALRKDARRAALLLSKVSLDLSCFGRWMPASYWDVFLEARDQLAGVNTLDPIELAQRARAHADSLRGGGLELEVDQILSELQQSGNLDDDKRAETRKFVLDRFLRELSMRTPEVIAACVQFKTARQQWSPYDTTDTPMRQLMADIVQATFSATYKTGQWPQRLPSRPARLLANSIKERFALDDSAQRDELAREILAQASSWEDPSRPFDEVMQEFRRFVPDEVDFPPPTVSELTAMAEEDTSDD